MRTLNYHVKPTQLSIMFLSHIHGHFVPKPWSGRITRVIINFREDYSDFSVAFFRLDRFSKLVAGCFEIASPIHSL